MATTNLDDLHSLATPSTSDGNGRDWFVDLVERAHVTPKGERVAQIVAANPRFASFASATEAAEKSGVHVATVVRFAQALGFNGWTEFQLHFRHRYLGGISPSARLRDQRPQHDGSVVGQAIRHDIHNLHAALTEIDLERVDAAACAIASAPRTLVVSSGSYLSVGHVLVHLANFMGFPLVLETRGGPSVVAQLAGMRAGDCLVAINFWHQTKHVVLTAQQCKERGITCIAITDSGFSPLARIADVPIIVPTESPSWYQSMVAPLSLIYGLLARLHELGGPSVDSVIENAETLYDRLDVLYG